MKKIKIKDIFIINNFFSRDELEVLSKCFSTINWTIDNNSPNEYADIHNNGSDIVQCHQTALILEEKNIVLKNTIEKDFNCSVGDEQVGTIVRYQKGWNLPYHADCWSNLPTYGGHPSRDISSILYLTDDFYGGSLLFPELGIEIEPMGGSVIYFPSDEHHMHEVNEVKSGNRVTCTGFWHVLKNGNEDEK